MPHHVVGHAYEVKADHRDGTAEKSQWLVPVPDELGVFARTVTEAWRMGDYGWGLHLDGGRPERLGSSAVSRGQVNDLYVAFFVFAQLCHGYPSDPVRSVREVPPSQVLQRWLEAGILSPAKVRKIGRGLRWKP